MNDTAKRRRSKLLSLPAILVVAVVTQAPILATLGISLVRWIVVRPDLGITFVGLDNYAEIFTSRDFYEVGLNTVLITVVSLAVCTLLGILFGLMLNNEFPGVNIVRTLIISPFFVMDAVAGIVWRTIILNSSFGWNEYFARLLGVRPFDFFGVHSLLTIIILIVWQWTPFFVLIILAGFQSIPEEIMDSARVDGMGWVRGLLFIRLPVIMNHIEVAVLLGLIFVLKVFGLIFVTTRGGPGYSSANLPFYVYKTAFLGWDMGRAAAVAVVTVAVTLVAVLALFRWFRGRISEAAG
jgi:sorbitol/mannitol transport system permease protein